MIFISYCEEDNQPVLADPINLGYIDWFLKELFAPGAIFDCSMKLEDKKLVPNEYVYFYKEDKRRESINIKLEKEIRENPIMISFLSPNYFKSKFCRREANLFYEQCDDFEYSKRHIFIDLSNIMNMEVDADPDEDRNLNISRKCKRFVSDSEWESIKQLYLRIKSLNPVYTKLFKGVRGNKKLHFLDNAEDRELWRDEVQSLQDALEDTLDDYIDEYLEIKKAKKGTHHVHVSANEKDISKAVKITKELWPESIVTAPWKSRKETAFDHAKCEKEYRQLCNYHVTFTTDPRDIHFIVEVLNEIGNIRKIKSKENDFILLAANDSSDEYKDFELKISEIDEAKSGVKVKKIISEDISEIGHHILVETQIVND